MSIRIFVISVLKVPSENSSVEYLFVQNKSVKKGKERNKEVNLVDFGSCLAFTFLSRGKEMILCRQYSNILLRLNIFATVTDIRYQEPVC